MPAGTVYTGIPIAPNRAAAMASLISDMLGKHQADQAAQQQNYTQNLVTSIKALPSWQQPAAVQKLSPTDQELLKANGFNFMDQGGSSAQLIEQARQRDLQGQASPTGALPTDPSGNTSFAALQMMPQGMQQNVTGASPTDTTLRNARNYEYTTGKSMPADQFAAGLTQNEQGDTGALAANKIATGQDTNAFQKGQLSEEALKRLQQDSQFQQQFKQNVKEFGATYAIQKAEADAKIGTETAQTGKITEETKGLKKQNDMFSSSDQAASGPDVRQTQTGQKWADLSGKSQGKGRDGMAAYYENGGIPAVTDKKDKDALQSIDATRLYQQTVLDAIQSKLPKDASGRVVGGLENKLSEVLQTDADIAAFKTFQTTAIQAVRASAGAGGLRITQQEIAAAMNAIPKITDTVGVAMQKNKNFNSILSNNEKSILGGRPNLKKATTNSDPLGLGLGASSGPTADPFASWKVTQ